jgi:hypothetical protein
MDASATRLLHTVFALVSCLPAIRLLVRPDFFLGVLFGGVSDKQTCAILQISWKLSVATETVYSFSRASLHLPLPSIVTFYL